MILHNCKFSLIFSVIYLKYIKAIQINPDSNSNQNYEKRQAYYNQPQFQFQYQPDLGVWRITWSNPPSFSGQMGPGAGQGPILVQGSATPVVPVKYPRPSKNNTVIFDNSAPVYKPDQTSSTTSYRDTNQNQNIQLSENCKCGTIREARTLERITGGNLSKENAWPWMAAIVYIGSDSPFWFCGASLINDQYLITAAHCQKTIKKRGYSNIRILIGTNGIPSKGSASNLYEIIDLKIHPSYRPNTEEYDIGLIKLKNRISFTDKISPICLTQRGSPFQDRMATVTGWGSIKYGESPPDTLREVDLKVVSNVNCQREYLYSYGTRITNAMLCAWLPGKDSCQGDSGGPLFLKTTSEPQVYTQIGVVSFGPPQCGVTTIPGVYTRVASTIRWIKSNTKDSTYCSGAF